MVKIKCVGAGIQSCGIRFKYDDMHTVDDKTANYLVKTFPKMFVKIENIKPKTNRQKVKKEEK